MYMVVHGSGAKSMFLSAGFYVLVAVTVIKCLQIRLRFVNVCNQVPT